MYKVTVYHKVLHNLLTLELCFDCLSATTAPYLCSVSLYGLSCSNWLWVISCCSLLEWG